MAEVRNAIKRSAAVDHAARSALQVCRKNQAKRPTTDGSHHSASPERTRLRGTVCRRDNFGPQMDRIKKTTGLSSGSSGPSDPKRQLFFRADNLGQ